MDITKYVGAIGHRGEFKGWRPRYVKKETHTRKDAIRENVIAAKDERNRLFKMHLARRAERLSHIRATYPNVRRYLAALERIEPDTTPIGWRDVDQDVAALAARLKIRETLTELSDRFLVYEETMNWVERIEKREDAYRPDHPDVMGEGEEDNTREQMRKELGIR